MLPNDFNLKTKYGHGVDWPIEYSDLKPYYERAERDIIGVGRRCSGPDLSRH